jgi:hypothetical protein
VSPLTINQSTTVLTTKENQKKCKRGINAELIRRRRSLRHKMSCWSNDAACYQVGFCWQFVSQKSLGKNRHLQRHLFVPDKVLSYIQSNILLLKPKCNSTSTQNKCNSTSTSCAQIALIPTQRFMSKILVMHIELKNLRRLLNASITGNLNELH